MTKRSKPQPKPRKPPKANKPATVIDLEAEARKVIAERAAQFRFVTPDFSELAKAIRAIVQAHRLDQHVPAAMIERCRQAQVKLWPLFGLIESGGYSNFTVSIAPGARPRFAGVILPEHGERLLNHLWAISAILARPMDRAQVDRLDELDDVLRQAGAIQSDQVDDGPIYPISEWARIGNLLKDTVRNRLRAAGIKPDQVQSQTELYSWAKIQQALAAPKYRGAIENIASYLAKRKRG